MSRFVVIGGSGFVGQELIRLLKQKGHKEFINLDIVPPSDGENYYEQDITRDINFKFNSDDIVVHLAANQYHHKVPRQNRKEYFFSVNVEGTKNILEKMAKDGATRMIFFSTDMVYGKPQYLPVDTVHAKNPFGFYGQSKLEAEQICNNFRSKGVNITIFRPRMIIGKGRTGILCKLFKLMDMNLPLPMIGNGRNCYQMVSVIDCAEAIILAVKKDLPNKEYNLGSSNPPKVKDLLRDVVKNAKSHSIVLPTWGKGVKLVLAALGKIGIEIMYKEQYMIADENYLIDITETEKDLGWHPKYNDKDMLFEAYQDYHRKY